MTHIQGPWGIEVSAQTEAMAKVLYWAWRTSNDPAVKDDSVDAWWPMVGNNQPISRSEWLEMAEAALSFSTPPAAPVRVQDIAHKLTGLYGSTCCHRTGGKSDDPDCECRKVAAEIDALSASPSPVDSRDGLIERLEDAVRIYLEALDSDPEKDVLDEDGVSFASDWSHQKHDAEVAAALDDVRAALAAKEQQP